MSLFKFFIQVNIWKTFYFNFHYFPSNIALRLPIYIYRRSKLFKMKGSIIIEAPIKTGMIKFGAHGLGTVDSYYQRTIWEMYGTLIVKGDASIGQGCKISIGKSATLTLGDHFIISGSSSIICQKKITFGKHCLLSWDVLMMDSDLHHVLNDNNSIINNPQPIVIGDNVWIGCRNTILKGVFIANDIIISANSTITRSVKETNCVIGGHGKTVEIIKRGINWKM